MELTNLERQVMEALLAGNEPALQLLAHQFKTATVTTRELTGAGFYTTFLIMPQAPRLEGSKAIRLGDVTAEIDGLQSGAGFVLFVNNGAIEFLEGFSYGEPWPEKVDNFRLSYMGKPSRDWARVKQELA